MRYIYSNWKTGEQKLFQWHAIYQWYQFKLALGKNVDQMPTSNSDCVNPRVKDKNREILETWVQGFSCTFQDLVSKVYMWTTILVGPLRLGVTGWSSLFLRSRERPCPPSPSLTTNALWSRRPNLSGMGEWKVDKSLVAVFAPMFYIVTLALRCPRPEGEAPRALLGALVTQWSLAMVRPKEMRRHDLSLLRWSRGGVRPGTYDDKVSMGPEGLMVVYVGCDIFP